MINKIDKMELKEQIKTVKGLIEGVYELGEFQDGWESDLEKGRELLKQLEELSDHIPAETYTSKVIEIQNKFLWLLTKV